MSDAPRQPSADVDPPPQTGDAAVDVALRRFHEAALGDVDGHAEAGEEVHGVLRDRLADLGGD